MRPLQRTLMALPIAAVMLASCVPRSAAQLTVFDPANYQENLLSAVRALEEVAALLEEHAELVDPVDPVEGLGVGVDQLLGQPHAHAHGGDPGLGPVVQVPLDAPDLGGVVVEGLGPGRAARARRGGAAATTGCPRRPGPPAGG